ncbi:MOSC domain-containing protein [Marinomonas transparens]|uniref:MOSC domain-containing protein n=1 Tax=Marinomonas transparens TaxID=2795388 RepID=A0A934JTT7_9GAMM|nr:MOSC N-terminal beta barrel domain-containing protein [Marinomonas transparens]MBJ7538172.1 MOSC domain-containing protein [Marinomonas transparens]
MSNFLSAITIYPVKSIQGIALQTSQVEEIGLWGDRRYVLVKPNGECITGRKHPTLTLVKAELIDANTWLFSHPNIASTLILTSDAFSNEHKDIDILGSSMHGQLVSKEANEWFSQVAEEEVMMVFLGEKSKQFRSRRPNVPIAFSDTHPFLLTTEASLVALNLSCPEQIQMAQFRPNLVIKGNQAFEEDSWKRIKIGEVEFENVGPCERCIFTTLNPDTAERSNKGEPLKTLAKFRLLDKGIHFGLNLVTLNSGKVNVDDTVEILEYQEADKYMDRR